jgi:hypothetical protein
MWQAEVKFSAQFDTKRPIAGQNTFAGSCEQGTEPSDYIQDREFLG